MSARGLVPCSPARAVERARRIAGKGGQYLWGTGNVNVRVVPDSLADVPWTPKRVTVGGQERVEHGSDCAGFAPCFVYELRRHRPGFNRRRGATIVDDINVDSALEDADPVHGRGELFERIEVPEVGCLVAFPSIRVPGRARIPGHIGIVVGAVAATVPELGMLWKPGEPEYRRLMVAHACGPNFRRPGVVVTDGQMWARHGEVWSKPAHRTRLLRCRVLEAVQR